MSAEEEEATALMHDASAKSLSERDSSTQALRDKRWSGRVSALDGFLLGSSTQTSTTTTSTTTTTMSFNAFGGANQSSGSSTPNNLFGAAKPTTGTGTNLFGGGNGSGTPNLFGNAASTPSTGGGLFGATSANTNASTANKPPLFGGFPTPSTTSSTSTPLFSTPAVSTTPAQPSNATGGLFGQTKPSEANPATTPKPAIPNFFNQPSTTPSSSTPPVAAGSSSGGLFNFSKPPGPAGPTLQPTSNTTSTPSTNIFGGGGLFGKPAATAKEASPATTNPAGGLFPGLGASNTAEKKDAPLGSNTPAFNVFGKPADKNSASAAPAATATTSTTSDKPKEGPSITLATPASSTAATNTSATFAVPPPSMLRGKTIEEIINRWSSELETHVRDFNRFAGEVAVWDRALIDNSKNLASLFSHVTAVEREQNEAEQSLDHIEQQQKDLSFTLDSYEKAMQDVLGGQGGSLRALDTGPADSERDKNYMLATDLHTQLDDLSGSLTQMIESVNSLSLSNGSKDGAAAEDPMSQISQILSSHLESLQWIDGAVKEVEGKITEVEKRVKDSGIALTGASSSAVKSRSFGLR